MRLNAQQRVSGSAPTMAAKAGVGFILSVEASMSESQFLDTGRSGSRKAYCKGNGGILQVGGQKESGSMRNPW